MPKSIRCNAENDNFELKPATRVLVPPVSTASSFKRPLATSYSTFQKRESNLPLVVFGIKAVRNSSYLKWTLLGLTARHRGLRLGSLTPNHSSGSCNLGLHAVSRPIITTYADSSSSLS